MASNTVAPVPSDGVDSARTPDSSVDAALADTSPDAGGDGTQDVAEDPTDQIPRPDDVTRRLALLWDPPAPPTRGRKARLTLAEVVEAGTAVAQEVGLEALSMRRVAARLGVGAMSLYTYVPGRTELVDLMIDRAFGELDLPTADAPWREGLSRYAREVWHLYQRHPWILQTNMWRLPLSPHVLDAQEAGLRTLVDTGLSAERVVEILGLVDAFVRGLARAAVAETVENDASGMSSDEYWTSMSSFWADWFDVERYPVMTRIWEAGGFDTPTDPFDASLDRLLDGVEMTIDRAREQG
ncbi:TetR/AcrR family transcriptional regulator [Oerskovia enterophila]|uniref:TetR/AcrR family transcriptional regulator n=1 Tax=Oerskovia enterophila TaxID=43678 RepID=UPI0033969CA1